MYQARYAYDGGEHAESTLPLQEGDGVILLEKFDEQWARVLAMDASGKAGLVPLEYLQAAVDDFYPVYVARRIVPRADGSDFASMGEKVDVLYEFSSDEWYVRHTESREVCCVCPRDFLPLTDDDNDADAPVRDMNRRFTNRFVVERSSGRSRTRSTSTPVSHTSTPTLHDSRPESTPSNRSTPAPLSDAESGGPEAPIGRKSSNKRSFRSRLSFRSKESKQKSTADKEERRQILLELDSTMSALKSTKSLKRTKEVKDLITTLSKMRHDVHKGRDMEKARLFLKKNDATDASGNVQPTADASRVELSVSSRAVVTSPVQPSSALPTIAQSPMSPVSSTLSEQAANMISPSNGDVHVVNGDVTPAVETDDMRLAPSGPTSPTSTSPRSRQNSSVSSMKPVRPKHVPPPPPPRAGLLEPPTNSLRRTASSPNQDASLTATSARDTSMKATPTSGSPRSRQTPEDKQLSRTVSAPSGQRAAKLVTDAIKNGFHPSPGSGKGSSFRLARLASLVMGSPANSAKETAKLLVEDLRVKTGSSFDNSCLAARTVLDHMREYIPDKVTEIDELSDAVQQLQDASETDGSKESHDAQRLDVIFGELTTMKNDGQQRNWTVHDDDEIITEYLEELLSILADADQTMCAGKVAADEFAILTTLAEYYQMESRVPIRLLLLKLFGGLCSLDTRIPSWLLNTNLPLELARDIKNDTSSFQKTLYSCLVATMMFSCGEKPPVGYYETWNTEFVLFLLDMVENPLEEDDEERLLDCALGVVLAFNYHFPDIDVASNQVMKALQSTPTTRNFCEKVLLFFNREEDPVALGKPLVPDAVLKLLKDMFADRTTAGLFYTSDTHVLIGIVARQLNDLPEGSELRYHYLLLLEELVQTTEFNTEQHGRSELATALMRIEEGEVVEDRNKETIFRIRNLAPCLAAS